MQQWPLGNAQIEPFSWPGRIIGDEFCALTKKRLFDGHGTLSVRTRPSGRSAARIGEPKYRAPLDLNYSPLPMTSIWNELGIIGGRDLRIRAGALADSLAGGVCGVGPNSEVMV